MSKWEIGFSTGCFYKTNILAVLEEIKKGGFSLLEICSYRKHLDYRNRTVVEKTAGKLRRLDLSPLSFHAPYGDWIDFTSFDEKQRHDSVKEILTAVEAAATLGAVYFVLHPGPEIDRVLPPEEYSNRLAHALRAIGQIAAKCSELGLTLLMENQLPDLPFGQVDDILRTIGQMNHRNIGVCLDTGHAHLTGHLFAVMQKFSEHLKLVHAADNRGKKDDHLPPGKGKIDWPQLVMNLNETRFQGVFILELSGSGRKKPAKLLQVAQSARQYLREISGSQSSPGNCSGGWLK